MYALVEARGFDLPMDELRALGCDPLYERGYITVSAAGKIEVSPLAADVPAVAALVNETLRERDVTCWTEARIPYFQWHRTYTFKVRPPA